MLQREAPLGACAGSNLLRQAKCWPDLTSLLSKDFIDRRRIFEFRFLRLLGAQQMKTPVVAIFSLVLVASSLTPTVAVANDENGAMNRCLAAWGDHPFGKNPKYKTLSTSVKVFGIGQASGDTKATAEPALVMVNAGVNVMGGSKIELLNPNGWYCLKSNVNVMGGMKIKAHCKAHLASAVEGVTVLGNNSENKAVTVMGKTTVELVGCK